MEKLKKFIREWLGLKDSHYYYGIRVQRIGDPHPDEEAFQKELMELSKKYPQVPAFFIQNLHWDWDGNDTGTFINLPDKVSLHAFINSSIFTNGNIYEI